MEYSTDKLGVQFTKKQHHLYTTDLETFREAVQWVKRELVREGYVVPEARLDPDAGRWHFYNAQGEHIFTAPHALIEHLWDLLRFSDGA